MYERKMEDTMKKKMAQKIVLALGCIAFLVPFAEGCKKENKGKHKLEYSCTMNGYGNGRCAFTNKGDAAGAGCIKVKVARNDNPSNSVESSSLCSGNVGVKETVNKDFSIPGVNSLCSEGGVSWMKICSFVVVEDK